MILIFQIVSLFVSCKMLELFEEYYEEAEKFLSKMTLEQKVGQMFFPKFINDTKDNVINTKFPGGFVLFKNDFDENEDIIIKNIEYIQKLSQNSMKLPLGLSVDEEGGTVNRISHFHRKEKFPSPHEIYNESGINGILKIEQEKRNLLRKFKMNINLAPVADFSNNSSDYIYPRTLGYPLDETIIYIKKEVESYVKDNFSCCAKHFPGYGNNINTHENIAIDDRKYEQFQKEDFKTFEAGIDEKIPMILVSHNIVKCKDDLYPASLSKIWHDILRNELKYSGLILTDDLSMDAITKYSGNLSPAIIAINAGNDILLTNQLNEHLSAAIEAVKNNTISMDTINRACKRIIAWKIKYLGAKFVEENDNTVLIIVLTVFGIIFLGIIFYFISKFFFCKKTLNSDIQNINGENSKLL